MDYRSRHLFRPYQDKNLWILILDIANIILTVCSTGDQGVPGETGSPGVGLQGPKGE